MPIVFYEEYGCTGKNYTEITDDIWPGDWDRLGVNWLPRSYRFSGKSAVNGVVIEGRDVCFDLSPPFEVRTVHMED